MAQRPRARAGCGSVDHASADAAIGHARVRVPDGPDRSRLWRWDLATGRRRVVRGYPRAIEFVDARGVNPGWVGLTSELPDGRLQASLLRFLGPDDRATPILEGDIVSWGPQGTTVIAARRGPLRTGCRRSVSIVWARLVPPALP